MIEVKLTIIQNGDELNVCSQPELINATQDEKEALRNIINAIIYAQPSEILRVEQNEKAESTIEKLRNSADFPDIIGG